MTAVRIKSAQSRADDARRVSDAGPARLAPATPADRVDADGAAAPDPVWDALRASARELASEEPMLASLVHMVVLEHDNFQDALSFRMAQKLASPELSALLLRDLAAEAMLRAPEISEASRADLRAYFERDPACTSYLQPMLYFKGFSAVQAYRVAHWYWRSGRPELARVLQMRVSEVFGVDIHPARESAAGLMIDHATGVVIGETAVVGDDVSMLHGVTLGGTGKETGDRHPNVGSGVLLGAGASVLGNIRIGHCSRVGAGSVVLADVPPCKTVAGVPAKVVGDSGCDNPSLSMNHTLP